MPKILQYFLDTTIAPGEVIIGHADYERLNLLIGVQSTPLLSLLTAIKFLGNKPFVPSHKGQVW